MKTHFIPAIYAAVLAVATLALVAGGCANTRPGRSPAMVETPREDPMVAQLRAEADLLLEKLNNTEKMVESLRRELSSELEKQRRFRESINTNFDLLEQSVALSLSKSVNAFSQPEPAPAPAVKPRPVAPASPPPGTVVPKNAEPAPVIPAHQPALEKPVTPVFPAPTVFSAPTEAPARQASAPANLAPDSPPAAALNVGLDGMDDPDLSAPASPRKLVAHPQAKPLYEKAFAHFARKEFDQAVVLFEDFLRRYPDDHYSDNAQFWVGEAHFRMGRLNQAELAYRNVLRFYEHRSTLDGYKTPDAIYRLGQTLIQRNDARTARAFFEAAVDRYPGSAAGRRAQTELNILVAATAAK